jgi:hypothetical protein
MDDSKMLLNNKKFSLQLAGNLYKNLVEVTSNMPKFDGFSKIFTFFVGTVIIVLVWVTSASGQVQLTENSKLAINGIGPIRVGMTVDEASRAAGAKMVKTLNSFRTEECGYFDIEGGPKGISFMVTKGRIATVNISNERVTTIRGIKIGDPEDKILKLYPQEQIQVVTGLIGGRMKRFTFVPRDAADRNYRLIFETGNNRVDRFRAGKLPEVEYLGGCL